MQPGWISSTPRAATGTVEGNYVKDSTRTTLSRIVSTVELECESKNGSSISVFKNINRLTFGKFKW